MRKEYALILKTLESANMAASASIPMKWYPKVISSD